MNNIPQTHGFVVTPRATRVPAAETPKGTIASPLIVAAILVCGLYFGREILIPIAIAILLSFVLSPLVNLLRRLRLGRLFSVSVSVLIAAGTIGALSTVIGVQVAELAADVPRYQATIERKVEALRHGQLGHAMDYIANINRAIHETKPDENEKKKADAAQSSADQAPEPPKPVLVEMKDRPPSPLELANTVLSPVVQPLATAGIVFVVLLFILMQREDLRDRLIRLAGSSDLHRTTVAMDDAARRLSRYFLGQLALNSAFGLVIGLGLWAIGVPNPVLWGIVSAVFRFVPYIGAFLSALLPLAVAAGVDPGWTMVIYTLILFGVIEPLVGHVIEPLVYGHSTGLSPFAVLVSALIWAFLWGPVGLLLSTPLTVCLVVLGRHVDSLEFLDVLFSDRAALTPVENFYQRMLADDPDEAQEHADEILQTCSLSSYYDDVVLRGLELASRDAARGVLTVEQKTAIRRSIAALIEELDERDDGEPETSSKTLPRLLAGARGKEALDCDDDLAAQEADQVAELPEEWQREGAVLCISGRGFLDEAGASIVAQLLRKRGFGTRIVPFSDVGRSHLAEFDPGPVKLICIVSLAISGEPAHLRRLVDRLRAKVPGVRIAVGLWRIDEDPNFAQSRRKDIGADIEITSVRDAVLVVQSAAVATDGQPVGADTNKRPTPPRQALPEPAKGRRSRNAADEFLM